MRIWPPQPPKQPPPPAGGAKDGTPAPLSLHDKVVAALREVYDPEIPVNIHDLGLIYKLEDEEATGKVSLEMTLTTPNCPVADEIPGQVRAAVGHIPEVTEVEVNLVWEPPWTPQRMSDDARLMLGLS